MEHIYSMEHYAAIEKDGFMSFTRTWMKLEIIILRKLTQNRKPNTTCSHSYVRVEQWEPMDTRRGTSHIRACWGVGTRGGIASVETPNVDDRLMGAANHHGIYIPM